MEDHRNVRFVEADFTGAWFRGVVFTEVKVSDAWLVDVDISGHVERLSVNGVDVSAFVEAELDRRHPERTLLEPSDPEGMRTAWATIEAFTSATLDRARALPAALLEVSVNDEWSYLDTLRHLVFATDRWITGPVLGESHPFHRLGRPNPPVEAIPAELFDLDATPTLDEVVAVRRERMDRVADLVAGVTESELDREVASPNGGTTTVRYCLHVVFREEWWHDRYANRDLAILAE